jgi:hypothetical protein
MSSSYPATPSSSSLSLLSLQVVVRPSWLEKIHQWEKALSLYEAYTDQFDDSSSLSHSHSLAFTANDPSRPRVSSVGVGSPPPLLSSPPPRRTSHATVEKVKLTTSARSVSQRVYGSEGAGGPHTHRDRGSSPITPSFRVPVPWLIPSSSLVP